VGLLINQDNLEYPLWTLLQKTSIQRLRIQHVNVMNASAVKSAVSPFAGFSPCAVILIDADLTSLVAEKGNYTQAWASAQELVYMQAWSSGPVRVFIKRKSFEEPSRISTKRVMEGDLYESSNPLWGIGNPAERRN
jgi:hypothetical protein